MPEGPATAERERRDAPLVGQQVRARVVPVAPAGEDDRRPAGRGGADRPEIVGDLHPGLSGLPGVLGKVEHAEQERGARRNLERRELQAQRLLRMEARIGQGHGAVAGLAVRSAGLGKEDDAQPRRRPARDHVERQVHAGEPGDGRDEAFGDEEGPPRRAALAVEEHRGLPSSSTGRRGRRVPG